MRLLRSFAYYTPWPLLLGFAVAALLALATVPAWYNACSHRVDLNPAHRCYIVEAHPR